MRLIFSSFAILFAGLIFFAYTKPAYDNIQTVQAQIVQYNAALAKAKELDAVKQTLLSKYNAFNPSDITRLETMLPDQVNNIGLILDLDTLATKYGLSLEGVAISDENSSSGAVGGSTQPYDSLGVAFSIHCTYAQFLQYVGALQSSLRIVDLQGISVGAGGTPTTGNGTTPSLSAIAGSSTIPDNNVYDFTINLRTYWLK